MHAWNGFSSYVIIMPSFSLGHKSAVLHRIPAVHESDKPDVNQFELLSLALKAAYSSRPATTHNALQSLVLNWPCILLLRAFKLVHPTVQVSSRLPGVKEAPQSSEPVRCPLDTALWAVAVTSVSQGAP